MSGFILPVADDDADHLTPGLAVPPVVLPATDGQDVCVAILPGRSVIVVYPWTGRPGIPNPLDWDNIPGAHGSTPELEGFRDTVAAFFRHQTRIFALSGQSTDHQAEMAARLALPFPVLSDGDGRFAAALALPSFVTGGDIFLKRLTLVVADGVIETVFYPVFDPAGHAAQVLGWFEDLRA